MAPSSSPSCTAMGHGPDRAARAQRADTLALALSQLPQLDGAVVAATHEARRREGGRGREAHERAHGAPVAAQHVQHTDLC
eukprot:scaffold96220_cov69-Phaeocystis_antarctica.AAC.2